MNKHNHFILRILNDQGTRYAKTIPAIILQLQGLRTAACCVLLLGFLAPNAKGQSTDSRGGFVEDAREIAALRVLYSTTHGENWNNNEGWPDDWSSVSSVSDINEWFGVTTKKGDIVKISLSENNLDGPLPEVMADLLALKKLIINTNRLKGSIPSEIGKLSQLQVLDLGSNLLTDSLPRELGKLTGLRKLKLGKNGLSGNIPGDIGKLVNLSILDLSSNKLTGRLPEEISNLQKINSLILSDNRFEGELPENIANLSQMERLHVRNNRFEGAVPISLKDLSKLRSLKLQGNKFTTIPDFTLSPNREQLQVNVSNNHLGYGSIAPHLYQGNNGEGSLRSFKYHPQFPENDTITLSYIENDPLTLYTKSDEEPSTRYRWQQQTEEGWQDIGVYTKEYTIARADALLDGAALRCLIQHPEAKARTHLSSPVYMLSLNRTKDFYTIADGDWSDTAIWSLTKEGKAHHGIPSEYDIVHIDGHSIRVTKAAVCKELRLESTAPGQLKVVGSQAQLLVNGIIFIKSTDRKRHDYLTVNHGGKLKCQNSDY